MKLFSNKPFNLVVLVIALGLTIACNVASYTQSNIVVKGSLPDPQGGPTQNIDLDQNVSINLWNASAKITLNNQEESSDSVYCTNSDNSIGNCSSINAIRSMTILGLVAILVVIILVLIGKMKMLTTLLILLAAVFNIIAVLIWTLNYDQSILPDLQLEVNQLVQFVEGNGGKIDVNKVSNNDYGPGFIIQCLLAGLTGILGLGRLF